MIFAYLFHIELIVLPLLLIGVLLHQRSKLSALSLQIAGLQAQLATVDDEEPTRD